jgi:RNA polymerase primary sigma factor/RNA polymerase sigma factor
MQQSFLAKGGPSLPPETTLWQQAQTGCRQTVNELMSRHDGLVHAVVRRQVLGDLPYEEALQAGRTGLSRAIKGYDPQRGTAFSTYAWTAIMRSVWAAVKAQQQEVVTRPLSGELVDEGQEPAQLWEKAMIETSTRAAVACLPERLQGVLRARYGWQGQAPATFRQIGAQLGVSKQRAHQLHQEALIRLRQPALSYQLRGLLDKHSLEAYQATEEQTVAWLRQRAGQR